MLFLATLSHGFYYSHFPYFQFCQRQHKNIDVIGFGPPIAPSDEAACRWWLPSSSHAHIGTAIQSDAATKRSAPPYNPTAVPWRLHPLSIEPCSHRHRHTIRCCHGTIGTAIQSDGSSMAAPSSIAPFPFPYKRMQWSDESMHTIRRRCGSIDHAPIGTAIPSFHHIPSDGDAMMEWGSLIFWMRGIQ